MFCFIFFILSFKNFSARSFSNTENFEDSTEYEISLVNAVSLGSFDLVFRLINFRKQDVNQFDPDGDTPLTIAAFLGRRDIVKLLIDFGADLNLFNKRGFSALFFCVQNYDFETAEFLVFNGAKYDQVSRQTTGKFRILSLEKIIKNYETETNKQSFSKLMDYVKILPVASIDLPISEVIKETVIREFR